MRVLIDFCNSQSQTYAFSLPPPSSTWYFRRGLFLYIANSQLQWLWQAHIAFYRSIDTVTRPEKPRDSSRPSASHFGPSGLRLKIRLFRSSISYLRSAGSIPGYYQLRRHTLHFSGPLTQLLVLKNLVIILGLRPRISALRASDSKLDSFVGLLTQAHDNSRPSASHFGPSGLSIRRFRIQVGSLTAPNAKLFNY